MGTPRDTIREVADQVSNFLHEPGDTSTAVYFGKLWKFELSSAEVDGVTEWTVTVSTTDDRPVRRAATKVQIPPSPQLRRDTVHQLVMEALDER